MMNQCRSMQKMYVWGSSWHFCRFHYGEFVPQAMARYGHYLAARAGILTSNRVLDIGYGVDVPIREIAHFTDVHITGLNINDCQISRARRYAIVHGLQSKQDFVKGDFVNMPLESITFDACYTIEVTLHAFLTDKYDTTNLEHQRIAKGIKLGCSLVNLATHREYLDALEFPGFEILKNEDRAVNDDAVP
ncbi:Delta(24)-sterol C-methyltransferase [Linnemannia hyalina]|uniref:Delta(24)-sterol C-methyltransferase n=1 Tax=Linnemannia hyalina TaxID=64524 RepID=A0A9P7XL22_9FUNG|nr:Delta(24)-sterol C-methyltransferase [Linnemannia hyalina]